MFAFEMKKAKKEKSSRFAESENFHKTHVKGFLYDAVFFHDFSQRVFTMRSGFML